MTNLKFSVIIPVFNAASTLESTIASVLQQTEKSFELIIVDDGSTDNSLRKALAMASKDTRIKVKSQQNMGVAAARNFGLTCAHGKLIAFLDADDLWLPNKLARHWSWHRSFPDIAISFAQVEFISNFPEASRAVSTVPPMNLSVAELVAENPTCTSSNIVLRSDCLEKIGLFREGMSYAEDQEWLVRACAKGLNIRGINCHLVDYRMSGDGLSANLEKMYAGWRLLASSYETHFDRSAAEAQYCRYLARRALRTGARANTALGFSLRGLRLNIRAFFSGRNRGLATLTGAIAAQFLPRETRIRIFA